MREIKILTSSVYFHLTFTILVFEHIDYTLERTDGFPLTIYDKISFNMMILVLLLTISFANTFLEFTSTFIINQSNNFTLVKGKQVQQVNNFNIVIEFPQIEDFSDQISRVQYLTHNQPNRRRIFLYSFHHSEDKQLSFILGFNEIIGSNLAVFLSLKILDNAVRTYIGVLSIIIGFIVLLRLKWKYSLWKFSEIYLPVIHEKNLSGGCYGPFKSFGQIIVDRNPRQTVTPTSLYGAFADIATLVICLSNIAMIISSGYLYLFVLLMLSKMQIGPLVFIKMKYLSKNLHLASIRLTSSVSWMLIPLRTYLPSFSYYG